MIKEKVENYLSENNIDLTLKSGRQHYFQPQTRLTGGTRGAWEEENNRLALEQVAVYAEEASDDYEIGDFMYYRTEYYDTEIPYFIKNYTDGELVELYKKFINPLRESEKTSIHV